MLKTRDNKFWLVTITLIIIGVIVIIVLTKTSSFNILPTIIQTKNHKPPHRTPGTFKENYGRYTSKSELTFNNDSTFTFKYIKSLKQDHPFVGLFFPLENLDIDFSKYDAVIIGIKTHLARRIPLNLSVQNNICTHQYVRQFIEVEEGVEVYKLRFEDFYTPSSWYEANKISQVEIPTQDFSQIEALSLESCHLLPQGIEDEYTINQITLTKDLSATYAFLFFIIIASIAGARIYFFDLLKSKNSIIHVPISSVEKKNPIDLKEEIILYIGKNYCNPDINLSVLSEEFGRSNNDISQIVKDRTTNTFPRYVNYLRLEEAKRLLKEGHFATISEVGYAVGFNSASNFIRVFKSQIGVSPKSYVDQEQD